MTAWYSQPRLYILIIMYPRNTSATQENKNLLYNILVNQLFNENPAKKFEKSWWYVWWFGANPLLLHPLSETKAVVQWKDESGEGHERCYFPESFPLARAVGNCLQKKNFEKSSPKIWRICLKLLTFATAFTKSVSDRKHSSLKEFHKQQTVQEQERKFLGRERRNRQSSI